MTPIKDRRVSFNLTPTMFESPSVHVRPPKAMAVPRPSVPETKCSTDESTKVPVSQDDNFMNALNQLLLSKDQLDSFSLKQLLDAQEKIHTVMCDVSKAMQRYAS